MTSPRPGLVPGSNGPKYARRIQAHVLVAGLLGLLPWALGLVWSLSPVLQWTLLSFAVLGWVATAASVTRVTGRPLHTLANLLAGLRRGDYSMRSALAREDDPLGVVMLETNALVETMQAQRIGALEATALLRKVMEEIDVAILAFDESARLRLVNRAGERLLGRPKERLEGEPAASLGLAELLEGPAPRTVELTFPGGQGRGELRRSSFREHGRPNTLLVLADLSRALREEELTAWRRLVRVLSHEINNSLTPIASATGSLQSMLASGERDEEWEDDLRDGLQLVESRARALRRFIGSYAKLARLPAPRLCDIEVTSVIERVVRLFPDAPLRVDAGPAVRLRADPDQLEQALINLMTNALDAVAERSPEDAAAVHVSWTTTRDRLRLRILDDGPGLPQTANLFVPFFSTKPGGSGIGLALCRQIVESHGGALELVDRDDGPGCEARLDLPLCDQTIRASTADTAC
jgi:two-component system, NtrC family, nitrogen regulation sensor histidine kinase NtrY